jgi:pimeloyl-ACP methyl ester carboxylesterase
MNTPDVTHEVATRVGRLHVRVTGHGPVAGLWHSLFIDSQGWYRVEPALSAQRTLVLIDGPSHGGSQPARRRFTLDDCAAAATEVLDQLGFTEPVDWVGSAWGGHVGMALAISQPERVRSLVTLGSPVSALSAAERHHIVPLVVAYALLGPARFIRSAVVDALLTPSIRAEVPRAEQLISNELRRADRRGLGIVMRSVMLGRPDLTGQLPHIAAPTLLMTGDDDAMWTAAKARAAAAWLPHGETAIIPGSRHMPALEAPDEVARLITAFWASIDSTPHNTGNDCLDVRALGG